MKRMIRVSIAMVLPVLLLMASSTAANMAFGQDLPPGPTTVSRSTLPGITMQGEFELINLILDFAPGAATPMHTHGGPGIVTVLDGEMVFAVEGKADQVAKAGEVYLDLPGTAHTAANKSATPARVSYFALLPKGATLTTVAGGQGGELPPGPTTVSRSTLPGITMQGEFDAINIILDFAPGAATPAHTHGGPGIVTVLNGEMTFGVQGKPDQLLQPGGVYADLPGTVHTAANKTASPARVSYAVVLPKGATLTTPVGGTQAQAPVPAQQPQSAPQPVVQQPVAEHGGHVGMPSTGAPVVPVVSVFALVIVLIGVGFAGLARFFTAGKQ